MIHVRGNDWSALVPPPDATWTPTATVSVCIPSHNPSLNLRRVLDALALQTYPTSLLEVVIADDGSDEPIVAPTGYPFPVSVVRLERTLAFGAGRARNGAARGASGELLVFLDADIVPERQAIAAYARWFTDRPDVLAMGLCRFADMDDLSDDEFRGLVASGGLEAHFAGREVDDQEWRENTFRRTDDLRAEAVDSFRITIGATYAIAAEHYWAVGGFRELGIRGIEDTEFGFRVHANGGVLVLDRDALHWHQGRRNMNLDRREQIRVEREPYVVRLIPVRGFRKEPPAPLDVPVHTVPRVVVHALGGAEHAAAIAPFLEPDQIVLPAGEVAVATDGMPFVPSFCDVWVPTDVRISRETMGAIANDLAVHGTGVAQIHAPVGNDIFAMRTRVHRRVCRAAGVDPSVGLTPELIRAGIDGFGLWHMAARAAAVEWPAAVVEVDGEQGADRLAPVAPAEGRREAWLRAVRERRLRVEKSIEAFLRRFTR